MILDYNHYHNSWEPDPPPAFRRFYQALLDWRSANQWGNRIAEHLPGIFRDAGIAEIVTHVDDETVQRGDPYFTDAAGIWAHVIETIGSGIVAAGFLDEDERKAAEVCCRDWVGSGLLSQTLSLRTVVGRVGSSGDGQ